MTMQLPAGFGYIPRKPGLAERLGGAVQQAGPAIAQALGAKEQQKQQSTQMQDFFNSLSENDPKNKTYKSMVKLWGSNLPLETKKALSESTFRKDPYQAERLRLNTLMSYLGKEISSLTKEMEFQKKDSPEYKANVERLAQVKGEWKALGDDIKILSQISPETAEAKEEAKAEEPEIERPEIKTKAKKRRGFFDVKDIGKEEEETPKEEKKAKIKFDENIPEHKKRAEELYEELGDINAVKEQLEEEGYEF